MIDMYAETCLHEASHAVAALALGVTVTRLAVDTSGDATAGECHLTLPDDPLHSVVILLAGTLGVNAFSHVLGNMPCIEPKQRRVEATHGQRCIASPEPNRVSANAWQSSPEPLGWGRDGGTILHILAGRPDADRIFDSADRLCREILSNNHAPLMLLTRRLARVGELNSSDFQDVSRAVIPVFAGAI